METIGYESSISRIHRQLASQPGGPPLGGAGGFEEEESFFVKLERFFGELERFFEELDRFFEELERFFEEFGRFF